MAEKEKLPIYKRQRFLLAFLRQIKDGVTATDLQKLVFLYIMKEKLDFYEFVPYKFGAYSFQLAEDVDVLRREGYISADGSLLQAIGKDQCELVFSIPSERGDKLIRKAYREYPYYAINSEITGRLFNEGEVEQFKQVKQGYTQTEQTLFTIGYEGKSVEAFINILIKNDVRVLCDVRKNPFSRKFGFSKGKLGHILETINIKYIHLPELGIESEKRKELDTVNDYRCLFREYTKMLSNFKPQLDYLYSLLCDNVRIALMCYEKEPEMCHRHVLRDYLSITYKIRSVDL